MGRATERALPAEGAGTPVTASPGRRRRLGRAASLGLATVGLVALAACLPVGSYSDGQQANLSNPAGNPPGANNFSCQPSAQHPYPVVLLPGTGESAALEFQALSPMLFNAGYCVFALDYGQINGTGDYAVGDIPTSAGQLATFVNQVLAATHAQQVDIVGHSQGGMMPRWYLKFLGGAPKVHMLVGLAPSNHGTTTATPQALQQLGLTAPAWGQQWTDSTFMQQLNSGGDTVPGPLYVVIETNKDQVVLPYTSAFLSGPGVIANITLQDQCPTDPVEHLGIPYDQVALTDVMNALAPVPSFPQPACTGFGPAQ